MLDDGYREWLIARGFALRNTVRVYVNDVRRFCEWCDGAGIDPGTASAGQVWAYLGSTGLKETRQRQIRAALSHWWAFLERTDAPVISMVKKPQGPPRCRPAWSVTDETRRFGEYLEAKGLSTGHIVRLVSLFEDAAAWFHNHGGDIAAATPTEVAACADAFPLTVGTRRDLRSALRHYWAYQRRKRPWPVDSVWVPQPPATKKPGDRISAGLARRVTLGLGGNGTLDDATAALLPAFVSYLTGEGLGDQTTRNYRNMARRVLLWCAAHGHDLATIEAEALRDLADELPPSSSTRRQLRTTLSHWWTMTGRGQPPVKAIRTPPKPRGQCRALSETAAALLAKAAADWWPQGGAVLLGLHLALRAEEIASTTWDRFNDGLTAYTITGKRDVTATIPVNATLRADLEHRRPVARRGYLFPGSRGREHVTPTTIGLWVAEVADAAGIGHVTPHQLRHTAGATMNDATGDLRTTQAFLRHASPVETARYTRTTWDRLRAAASSLSY